MVFLSKILQNIDLLEFQNSKISINSIITDNRLAKQNDLFVAIKGTATDSHQYIKDAISKGVSAVVCEYIPADRLKDFNYIVVKNSREIIGQLASNFYDNPSSKLKLIGVTGTNGKTTVATLLKNLFTNLGYKTALISTIQNVIGEEIIPSTHTTPDPVSLNALLAKMVEKDCEYCFMEVSSHAVDQNRIGGLTFAGGIFTNITHDHLDYHKTFDNYLKAKKKFFDNLPSSAYALTNKDDRNGLVMLQNTKASKYTYSLKNISDFKGKIIESDLTGLLFEIDGTQAWYGLSGDFNAYNLLAVYGTAFILDIPKEKIIEALTKTRGAKGRFEIVRSETGVLGVIDYAHTPDAIKNVLETINKVRSRNETLTTIIGCGGDRDKEKRPIMGDIASTLSDKVIFTSDNPRSEDPETILAEMKAGVKAQHFKKILKITNREEAIQVAVSQAKKGDIILLAGKGHEDYQDVNGVKTHFDDFEKLKQAFENIS
ncbi:MAG: UDP-N-acetylmuramoyl-L-alanyl-D-glutamate--2,6-diaminopimelate ligase [Bacteroidia bacterium]